jgi:hypothetical protein
MRATRYSFTLILLAISMFGCAGELEVRELDPNAFSRHFVAQQACMSYVDSLVAPAIKQLSLMRNPEDMRAWISEHPRNSFSELVAQVQRNTMAQGALNPRIEADQIKVAAQLFEVMKMRADFEKSSCGPDVREHVMESLYLGLGGESSLVSAEFRRRGIGDSWEQRWVLLTILMAGIIDG